MAINKQSEYVLEQFNLEENHFSELANLITTSFLADEAALEDGATIAFSEETFRTFFGAPSVDRRLFVKTILKETGDTVGFLGLINRTLRLNGDRYKFAVPTWLAVHPKHQRQGLASAMGYRMFEILKEHGYDGGFGMFEPEQHGIDTTKSVLRKAGISITKLVDMKQFVIRVFDADATASVVKVKWYEKLFFKLKEKIEAPNNPRVRLYKESDFEQFFTLLIELTNKNEVSIIPDKRDIEWILKRPNVICVVHEDEKGKIDGFIYGWQFNLAGFGKIEPYGWLETVHSYKMAPSDVKDLANFLCLEAKKRGWKGLQTPYIPYFDPKPLKRANFIFFSKKISLDIATFNDLKLPKKVNSIYFDWR
ncbi:MAG: GNAT family N-acetyltransferase [Asgard group archaeon]|nr:GNAT family N-acetyltransferase [Asgard group archaeon]